MCGIAGFWNLDAPAPGVLARMADALRHRGPDDAGTWIDAGAGVALAHRRLAIVDLSPAGHQPMHSASGRFTLVFNGEVYNFDALRRELSAYPFRGHADTEVMLAAFEAWGVEAAVRRFVGMFAFAVWDHHARTLTLGRDRLGIKPLYYTDQGPLRFASELSALTADPAFQPPIDPDALAAYLRLSYVPAPRTIYAGVRKLRPGHLLTAHRADAGAPSLHEHPFWSLHDVAHHGHTHPFAGSDADAADALDALLRDAVGLRMIADVPLGAFLSGGVDSSTVVAIMQQQATRPVRTFSIGFEDAAFDEAPHARAVAQHLGTDHTELYVSERDVLAVVPQLGAMYDEPFADASQIPTFLVSALARQSVTVALSGDGGDELFAGYNRHRVAAGLWPRLARLPLGARKIGAGLLRSLTHPRVEPLMLGLHGRLPARWHVSNPADKLAKLADVLPAASDADLYARLTTTWPGGPEAARPAWRDVPGLALAERMMLQDALTYLPDDVLTKVDRASMAVSLEARVPLLDHRVVAFAWTLPMAMKLRGGQSKWLLRQVLDRYVPRPLIERPKQGFGVPIGRYLRGPLRDWAEDLLTPAALEGVGLDAPAVRRLWRRHLAGHRGGETALWNVLLFQAWRTAHLAAPATPVAPVPAEHAPASVVC